MKIQSKTKRNLERILAIVLVAIMALTIALQVGKKDSKAASSSYTLYVGPNRTYKTINAALDAISTLGRNSSERVTIMIDPGNYEEMVVVNQKNVTFKNSSSNPSTALKNKGVDIDSNAVRITWYYGHGYSYYSMGSDYKYSASTLSANKKNGKASTTNPGAGTATYWNASVVIAADGFQAEGIIFENSFNQYVSAMAAKDVLVKQSGAKEGSTSRANLSAGSTKVQEKEYVERAAALAIANNVSKADFLNCKFVGRQDTLFGGSNATAVFENCSVYGGTDYIFGGMKAVFYKCNLVANTSDLTSSSISNDRFYITAPQQKSGRGYLFWECRITSTTPGVDTASSMQSKPGYFGRPWAANTGEAVFYKTTIEKTNFSKDGKGTGSSSLIEPAGWLSTLGGESKLCGEYGTIDLAGASTSKRASWAQVFSSAKLADGTAIAVSSFMDSSWLSSLKAEGRMGSSSSSSSTTAATTASSSTSSTSKSWNFKNTGFNNLETISSSVTVDGLTLVATSSKTMSVKSNSATVDGTSYTYALSLGGGGSTSYRAIKVPVSGTDTIKVVLKSSGSSSRTLVVADASGKQLGTLTAGTSASVQSYSYSGSAGYVYLYSSGSNIDVYKVQVDSKSSSSSNTTAATTTAKQTTAATTTAKQTTAATTTAKQTTAATTTTKQTTAATTVASGSTYMFNPGKGLSNSYFTVSGNLATDKGSVTYNGTTLSTCLKVESSTSVKFTTKTAGAKLTVIVKAKASGGALKVNGTTTFSNIGTSAQTLTTTLGSAGTYEIKKGSKEVYIYYIIVEDGSSSSSSTTTTVATTTAKQTTAAATTAKTTTAATSSSTSKSWNFKNTGFNNLGTISSSVTVDGLTLIATSSKTMSVKSNSATVDGTSYTYALSLGGGGSTSYRAIKVPVSGTDTIKVVLKSSGSSSRTLVVADASGKQLGTLTAGASASVQSYSYSGSAGYVYLYSSGSNIDVYKVQVDSKSSSSSSSGTTAATTASSSTSSTTAAVSSGDIYVSPSGKSSASGTSSDPMDIATAVTKIKAGNTIWMQAGTYKLSKTILIAESNSGKSGSYKKISSINGGTVTLDFSSMSESGSNRGIVLDGSYWHIYDVDIKGAGDNGILLSGDNNIIELCQFYENHDSGLQISRYNANYTSISQWPSYNTIKNCTSFNNKDEATSENADGFAAKLTCGEGNVFDGCIAYCNSDDGWDLYAKPETGSIGVVTIKNCVAFGNGKLTDGSGSANGDMNGFKLGGSSGQCPTPHKVSNSIAFYNGACGFTDNGNGGAVTLTNCTAASNGKYAAKANFLCYRTSSSAKYTNLISFDSNGSDKFLGLVKTSVFAYSSKYYYVSSASYSGSASTSGASSASLSSSDFTSISVPGYSSGKYGTNYHTIFRNSDGSVNLSGLFQIKTSTYKSLGSSY